MASSDEKPEQDVVTTNIRTLMKARGIGGIVGLREAMKAAGYTIGNSTIQRALAGGGANRLNSLDKFAAFFDVTTTQLLQPGLGMDGEPPPRISVAKLSPQLLRLIQDLEDIPDRKRNALLDQIHQVAEEAREAEAHFEKRRSKTTAHAVRGAPRAMTTGTVGDGNERQGALPWDRGVTDPFSAEPTERESAWYRHLEGKPKAED